MSEKLIVISSYPPQGSTHHKAVVGVATYTKNTVTALSQMLEKEKPDARITVLAEKLPQQADYAEKNIIVKRVWKRNHIATYLVLLKHIMQKDHTNRILLELEIAMFGEKFMLVLLPLFLLLLRLCGKEVTTVTHQVITDITELSGHVYVYKKGIKTIIINQSLRIFYFLILLFSHKVIVFDAFLKDRLPLQKKIVVIPHGVENFHVIDISQQQAKEKLSIPSSTFVLLYFGFLAYYKGADLLIQYYKKLQVQTKDTLLIMAGGPNPNHVGKPSYDSYINNIKQTAEQQSIMVTGFVDEKDIPLYFTAADVVIFPYRTLMSASGPLSMSFSFHKPFLVSHAMKDIFKTADIKHLISEYQSDIDDLSFENQDDFCQKIIDLKSNSTKQKAYADFSQALAQQRSWEIIGKHYYQEIYK